MRFVKASGALARFAFPALSLALSAAGAGGCDRPRPARSTSAPGAEGGPGGGRVEGSESASVVTAAAAAPLTGPPTPVTGHPRLWVRQADLPQLRSWAVASNPVYKEGLEALATDAKKELDVATVGGGECIVKGNFCETYAQLFAFMYL
ncbi:MAG TPA: hypothetical protein VFS00_27790, partial [Polyangiaceae bacterium]|nr:hypothetical protein [Polyangiaceae bacterium]